LEQAIKTLSEGVVHASAVGVGTPAGTLLLDRDSLGVRVAHHDWAGRDVTTRLVEQNLQDIARRTGGRYVRWSGEASVQPIIDQLGQVRRRAMAGDIAAPRADRFQWLLAAALAALVASSLVVRGRRGSWP
jgi:hypothetical protein